jgi:hypothetical protein
MVIDLKTALSHLPLPATPTWPDGVWDKALFTHSTIRQAQLESSAA